MGGAAVGEDAGIGAAIGLGLVTILSGGAALPLSLAAGAGLGALGGGLNSAFEHDKFNDIGGGDNAASNAKTVATQQASDAAGLQKDILEQPKQVSPDNFLATKNRLLNNMRLGLSSTITSGAGTPPPVLSTPALTGASGKKTLGS